MTILKNDILPVLGLDSGYTVKYSPPPLEVISGFALGNSLSGGLYLTVYPLSCPNTDTTSEKDYFYINKVKDQYPTSLGNKGPKHQCLAH